MRYEAYLKVVFLSKNSRADLRDFSMPFTTITNLELKQPIFGQNYIVGVVKAAPGGTTCL